jgi:putative membrane protein
MWFLGNWMHFGWFVGFGFLATIAVIVVVIVLVSKSNNRARDNRPSNAEQILKERLARGEIDEETYDNLLKKIR